jgi:D-alanyl-D-alanine carboxypeptidase
MASPCRAVFPLLLLGAMAGCASHHSYRAARYHPSGRHYVPPGPPEDPWGPYIREASARFGVPDQWVREVMRQESGGEQYLGGDLTTSPAGAMGLMQVMPDTYDGLRQRYRLGDDPYDPHDNILAGTAYIREMYDRYGAPGFLAAYNAGPQRLDGYLGGATELPDETINYVASVAPRLGSGTPLTGPLSVYGDNRGTPVSASPAQAAPLPYAGRYAGGTQPLQVAMEPIVSPGDYASPAPAATPVPAGRASGTVAAALPPPVPASAAQVAMEPIVSPGDYAQPAQSQPAPALAPAPPPASQAPQPTFRLVAVSPPRPVSPSAPASVWSIQVGAFATPADARTAAESARALVRFLPARVEPVIGSTSRTDGTVLFRARLKGMSGVQADDACRRLRASGRECMVIPPDGRS